MTLCGTMSGFRKLVEPIPFFLIHLGVRRALQMKNLGTTFPLRVGWATALEHRV